MGRCLKRSEVSMIDLGAHYMLRCNRFMHINISVKSMRTLVNRNWIQRMASKTERLYDEKMERRIRGRTLS